MKTHARLSGGSFVLNTVDVVAVLEESAAFLSPLQLSMLGRQLENGKLWSSL